MSGPLDGVALVGMAGRFPDANSVEELWALLVAGYDGISRFTPEQLSSTIPESERNNPSYVAARGVIADADRFDAAFFGIPSREALLMDPQQRMLLELSWNALEHAGVDPDRYRGSIGVYAGTSNNGYRKLLDARPDLIQASGEFAAMLGNEKDYVATRIAHRLGLNGPAISIHTACSTSLVAICQAWYALMSWQCDLALAGGINLVVPQESGYLPVDGGMESGDGTCRPYDAAANGTVFSSGGGMLAMKRLADAQADGDTIFAVLRGVGVNNDGADKASFTAPSVRGQASAIRLALGSAGVGAETIGYVEGHGTGTALGDPIEVEALTRAYREDTDANQYCWLGSLKGNFGHLVAGSGVAGLIKAALTLHHQRIPPTLHYRQPNPEIDFANTPFKVSNRAIDWPRNGNPRRAGVSSFGVGGTNAHVVLEEAPLPTASADGRAVSSLLLSARDEPALQRRVAELASALEEYDDSDLPDLAYTLGEGRRTFEYRCQVTAATISDARTTLARMQRVALHGAVGKRPPLVFVFSGQGSQHANMARGLMASEPAFRDALDEACQIATPLLGRSLLALIHPSVGKEEEADALLAQTGYTQPALFAIEVALARWYQSIGIEPDRMIGHSIGEYVAACLAGVFSLHDAMAIVIARAAAMQAQAEGAMLAVRSGVESLPQLPAGVEVVAINAPQLTVVAGPVTAIHDYADALASANIVNSALRVSHAFHSASMDGAIERFRRAFDGISLNAPTRPFHSCVSGKVISDDEATSPDYWCRQLRQPVQFLDAVRAAAQDDAVFLEVGPGQALTGLIRRTDDLRHRAIASLGQAGQDNDAWHLINAVGELACRGVMADSTKFHAGQQRRMLPLPTYPFHGARYWIEPPAHTAPVVAAGIVMPTPSSASCSPSPTPLPASPVSVPRRRLRLAAELTELFENLSGESIGADGQAIGFLQIGLDSLALTQAALELERRYGLKLKFRRLMEDLDNVNALSELLDRELPPEVAAPLAAATPVAALPASLSTSAPSALAELIQSQLALLQQQSALLSSLAGTSLPATTAPAATIANEPVERADLRAQPFGASARISTDHHSAATPAQRQWIDRFIGDYNDRTARSKAFSQTHRQRMADPRVVTGFNPLWKELVYPIVVERSRGPRLWDIDGNEYIDLLNSFGANFLGYQPDYITHALKEQIDRGMEIGPQHPLTAEVADLISEMTGMQRVAFCNTGSEAVMGAMRIARTVTGRNTIVIFTNSYHGIFDEVIVRGTRRLRSIAAAPGILASAVENVLVLDYGSDEALAIIRERGSELAAVMIEPVQGKNPTLQPRQFVHALRGICDEVGCALIFDEVITGFRVAQGGAQEYYGVRADIATYGKVIGGGLPLAVIAGSPKWLDALDGGDWQFGDDSYPEAGVTYFAGTFVRHPLALAAARAALLYLKREGPQLQRNISARSSRLVDRLNAKFRELRAPLKAIGFSSLWRILVDEDQPYAGLFWYSLRQRGLHVYEQFNCFLTEAHGELEVDEIVDRVGSAARTLLDAGLLTRTDAKSDQPEAAQADAADRRATTTSTGSFPLSDAQRDKWLACQYGDEANTAFNESMLLQFEGVLDVGALKRSLDTIAARHDALRLRFAADGSGQSVDADANLELVEIDLSGSDADDRLAMHCHAQMSRPFDLEQAPLVRMHLVRLAADRHVLLFIGHHLVFDGWSATVLLDELAQCYNAAVSGTAFDLVPAESYRSYVEAERQRRSGENFNQTVAYWQQQFASLPALLALPSDRPRERHPEFAGATFAHDFSASLTAALRALARRRGVTLYSVLLHGFARLLAELSGQTDLVIGIPFAGQAIVGSGNLMGDGADMVPVRLQLETSLSATEALLATHGRLLDAADHQDLSINTLVRKGVLPKVGPSLARVVFNLNPRMPSVPFVGLRHELRDCAKTAIFWDMFVNLNEVDDGLSLDLHYASSLFDPPTIAAFVKRYQSLLVEMAASAGDNTNAGVVEFTPTSAPTGAATAVHALPADVSDSNAVIDAIIAAAANAPALAGPVNTGASMRNAPSVADARHAVLSGPESDIDPSASVPAMIAAQAEATPLRIAVEAGARRLTYAGLVQRIDALAAQLVDQGILRGELVGVCLPRGVELPIAVLGVQRAGAAYVALDASFPVERLLDIAEQAKLRSIVTLDSSDVPVALAKDRHLIAINALDLRAVATSTLPTLQADDLAYVLFTSGSTGRPKGVRILQRNLVNFLGSMLQVPGFSAEDALVAVTTLSFDISGLELYLPLLCGGRVVIADDEEITDPLALKGVIHDCDVSVLQTTPTLLRMLLDGAGDDAVTGLKLLVGGEALPRSLADRALSHASELWNMYGPTETTIWSTVHRVHADATEIALGQPIANTSIRLLDDNGNGVAAGERGEIVIGGAGVADGYLDRAELTAERFLTDDDYGVPVRLYRSGDIGSIRDGRLYYHGRSDSQVKLRGHRIELGEIEATAMQVPALRDAAAKVHEAAPGDQRLLLYVSATAAGADPTDTLRSHLLERLPGYMIPQQIIVLDALPKTPNGKLDRNALPVPTSVALAVAPMEAKSATVPGRDARTAWLAALWCEMIGLQQVGNEDNFFEIGGHSLLAVEMASHVQKETGVRVNLLMIATGTLGSLAAMLPAMGDEPAKPSAVSKMLGLFGIGRK